MEMESHSAKAERTRGRTSKRQKSESLSASQSQADAMVAEIASEEKPASVEQHFEDVSDENLSSFSGYLRHTLKQDHSEITRIANALDVAENTIYRWINGSTEPRPIHLKKLLDALPMHRRNLTYAINHTFPGALDAFSMDVREVQKDIYLRVVELASLTLEDDDRCWQITQAIFEYALLHLDAERRGLAITYAKLTARREDGFHSLCELDMSGTSPWPFTLEARIYLGSNTLAGRAAMTQRIQAWESVEGENRMPVVVDEFEKSACAYPVMLAGRMAGVLIVSSTQPDFFAKPLACQAVVEYAQLLALGLRQSDFYPCSEINLKPMPDIRWQRDRMSTSYLSRVIICARQRKLSLPEAEEYVRSDMEVEFEEAESASLAQRENEKETQHAPSLEQGWSGDA